MNTVWIEIVQDAMHVQTNEEGGVLVFFVHTIQGDERNVLSLDMQTKLCFVEY